MGRYGGMAVALRARGGRNMLLQTRGIAANDVKEAAKQVVASLSRFARNGGRCDPEGPGDHPPNFSYGYISVNNSRHRAIYRLVNAVYVIIIAMPGTPIFALAKMVDAISTQLVETCKGPEVTLDKVAKKYAEIYVAIGALLAVGGASLSLAANESAGLISLMFPDDKKERKISSFGKGRKPEPSTATANLIGQHSTGSQPCGRRSLADGLTLGDATVDGPVPATSTRNRRNSCRHSTPSNATDQDTPGQSFSAASAELTAPLDQRSSSVSPSGEDQHYDQWSPQRLETSLPGPLIDDTTRFDEVNDMDTGNLPAAEASFASSWHAFGSSPEQAQVPDVFECSYPSEQTSLERPAPPGVPFIAEAAAVSSSPFDSIEPASRADAPDPHGQFSQTADQASWRSGDLFSGAAGVDSASPGPSILADGNLDDSGWADDSLFGNSGSALCAVPADAQEPVLQGKSGHSVGIGTTENMPFTTSGTASVPSHQNTPGDSLSSAVVDANGISNQDQVVPSDPQLAVFASGPHLTEIWQADFCSQELSTSQLTTEVKLPPGSVHDESYVALVAASDTSLPISIRHTIKGDCTQDMVMRCHFPPAAIVPPVLVQVSIGRQLGDSRDTGSLHRLLTVQYSISPAIPSTLQDATVQVHLPESMGLPSQAFPIVGWNATERILQWEIPSTGLLPGYVGVLQAVLSLHTKYMAELDESSRPRVVMKFATSKGTFSGIACSVTNTGASLIPQHASLSAIGLISDTVQ